MQPAAILKYGKVCPKHPELKGLRRKSNRQCPECNKALTLRWRAENQDRYLAAKRAQRIRNGAAETTDLRGLTRVTTAALTEAWK
jgi:hypothetical protein